jgi:hypothetical protein
MVRTVEIGIYGEIAASRDAGNCLAFKVQLVDIAGDVLGRKAIGLEGGGRESPGLPLLDSLGNLDCFRDAASAIDIVLFVFAVGMILHGLITAS